MVQYYSLELTSKRMKEESCSTKLADLRERNPAPRLFQDYPWEEATDCLWHSPFRHTEYFHQCKGIADSVLQRSMIFNYSPWLSFHQRPLTLFWTPLRTALLPFCFHLEVQRLSPGKVKGEQKCDEGGVGTGCTGWTGNPLSQPHGPPRRGDDDFT